MIIENEEIYAQLENAPVSDISRLTEILSKAREMKGIDYSEVLCLIHNKDREIDQEIFNTARYIKNEIYGNRLVLFAPLYISNLCNNECLYCAFRCRNKLVKRKSLGQDQIKKETAALINRGHKRLLLVAGEAYPQEGLKYVFNSIDTIYKTRTPKGNIRRINVNIAPLSVRDFKELYACNIGTYQLFQETYHEETYKKLHVKGPKADYNYRLEAVSRAFEAGFNDVGIGVLFGLADWKYELLAMFSHIRFLEKEYGIGPHTISVPRIEPASGSDISYNPPFPLDDHNFKKIIAIIRIAVPYTGIILSTRESSAMRREAFELGISQISAGSRTNPGGYTQDDNEQGAEEQFSLGDTRSLSEVIQDMVNSGHIPSFCTGCYRLGRVGKDFMDLAKPGLIKQNCLPNAIFTFAEYLHDFASDDLKDSGFSLIHKMIKDTVTNDKLEKRIFDYLKDIEEGKRDVYI